MAWVKSYREHQPRIGQDVFVAETAVVVGDVELQCQANVWYGAVLRADVGAIRVGERSNIQDQTTVHMTHQVSDTVIGSDVIVGHNCVIHGATIADRALIGMGSELLDNARIEQGAWVAAGSVVPPGFCVPTGMLFRNGKIARAVRESEQQWAREALERYLELAREHQQL